MKQGGERTESAGCLPLGFSLASINSPSPPPPPPPAAPPVAPPPMMRGHWEHCDQVHDGGGGGDSDSSSSPSTPPSPHHPCTSSSFSVLVTQLPAIRGPELDSTTVKSVTPMSTDGESSDSHVGWVAAGWSVVPYLWCQSMSYSEGRITDGMSDVKIMDDRSAFPAFPHSISHPHILSRTAYQE